MKTAFRMLISTLTAAAVLYALRLVSVWFFAQSMLGETVDKVVKLCLAALAALTLLLYLRCWLSLLISGVRALVHRKDKAAPAPQVHLSIGARSAPRLFDARAAHPSRRSPRP